jgi:hypothetical protein
MVSAWLFMCCARQARGRIIASDYATDGTQKVTAEVGGFPPFADLQVDLGQN